MQKSEHKSKSHTGLQFQRPKKNRLNRDEKAAQTYANLMQSAADIVGAEGYAATTIAKVADGAGVAHGTFYNYFKDRQALFDVLLPHVGQQMTDWITDNVKDAGSGLEREVARFRAYCTYLKKNPGFYRILYEAEVFAPKAYTAHIGRLSEGYSRALKRAMDNGQMRRMTDRELDTVIAVLLGARAYISMQYKSEREIPETAIQAYADLMSKGLFV